MVKIIMGIINNKKNFSDYFYFNSSANLLIFSPATPRALSDILNYAWIASSFIWLR